MPDPIILFHGTNKRNVKSILLKGFYENTYFARHLEDAIAFGGPYVFQVLFDNNILPENWQVKALNVVPAERIIRVDKYFEENIYNKMHYAKKIFKKYPTLESIPIYTFIDKPLT